LILADQKESQKRIDELSRALSEAIERE
jgi:hypothetical protein